MNYYKIEFGLLSLEFLGAFRVPFHTVENDIRGKHEQNSEDDSEEINSLLFPKKEKIRTMRL